jgi:Cu/Ag efflux protein CusF
MRIYSTWVWAAALCLATAACSQPQPAAETPADTAAAPAPSAPVRSRGVVQTVTREYGAITIQHAPIPEYDMPAMVMEFTVDNPAQLEGLEAGDTVTFELRSGLDISSIAKEDAN